MLIHPTREYDVAADVSRREAALHHKRLPARGVVDPLAGSDQFVAQREGPLERRALVAVVRGDDAGHRRLHLGRVSMGGHSHVPWIALSVACWLACAPPPLG
jgi:hypothetical protein